MLNFKVCPAPEWTDASTGQVIPAMGRIVKTGQMIAVEGLFDQEFDRFMQGIREGEGGDPSAEAIVVDGETIVKTRGKITEFSKRSQARLMKALSGWEPHGDLLIVTLTYPKEFPDCEGAKADFERFRRKLLTKFPHFSGLWKIEYQTRGAPHFHLVIDANALRAGVDLRSVRLDVNDLWKSSRGNLVPARTQVDFARQNSAAKFYLVKEVGKMAQSSREWRAATENAIEHVGRVWGWINPKRMRFQSEEWAVPVNIGWIFRAKIQGEVEKSMLKRGHIVDDNGVLKYRGGAELDRGRLPSWQLLVNPEAVFDRICREIREETGFDFWAHAQRLEPDFETD